MLKILAALLVVFGLIGVFSFLLRYLHSKGKLVGSFESQGKKRPFIENSTQIDNKRKIISIVHGETRHIIMCGQNNDILLESSPLNQKNNQRERQHA